MTRWQFFLAQLKESALWFDQGCNVLAGWGSFVWSILAGREPPEVHSADETVSAHLWRSKSSGKLWGRFLVPPVDYVFSLWQRDAAGARIHDHCHQAFLKESAKFYLPAAYHADGRLQA